MPGLPRIMVAPNGARLTKADHPAVPISITEIIACGKACYDAGAGGMHAHVRDGNGEHVLDVGLYRELLNEAALQIPDMMVQITTEAVGKYNVSQQREIVRQVMPQAASFALREMLADNDTADAENFYHWAEAENISLQHILYGAEELQQFLHLQRRGVFGAPPYQLLFVLGRYSADGISRPQDLQSFLDVVPEASEDLRAHLDWAVCAFGRRETECLRFAVRQGGKCRIGFENSLYNEDGSIATDNVSRVRSFFRSLCTDAPSA